MIETNYPLPLQANSDIGTERATKAEGTTVEQPINVAVAEKLSALRIVEYLRERAARVDLAEAETLLESFDAGEPSREGDELMSGRS